jgi:hypothetical protein
MSGDGDWDLFRPVLSTDVPRVKRTQAALPPPSGPATNRANAKRECPAAPARPPETQAEIDAWIAERRKRFPTQARVAERAQGEADRAARGALDLAAKPKAEKKSRRPQEMSSATPTKIPSFIDRLTEDEDRRQRSMVLQCFRYFTTHNFLQDDPETDR